MRLPLSPISLGSLSLSRTDARRRRLSLSSSASIAPPTPSPSPLCSLSLSDNSSSKLPPQPLFSLSTLTRSPSSHTLPATAAKAATGLPLLPKPAAAARRSGDTTSTSLASSEQDDGTQSAATPHLTPSPCLVSTRLSAEQQQLEAVVVAASNTALNFRATQQAPSTFSRPDGQGAEPPPSALSLSLSVSGKPNNKSFPLFSLLFPFSILELF